MRTAAHELQYALRALARSKRISLTAISLFAVTIGISTAIYSVVEAVMLRPIGMRASDRTAVIWQRDDARGTPVVETSHGEVDAWRRSASSVEAIGVFSSVNWSLSLVDGDSRTRLAYAAVSAPFFEVVAIPAVMGRVLNGQDEAGNEPRVAVISDQVWRQRFGASPRIIGATIRVQEDVESPVRSVEVVGVMPPEFDFPRGAQLWMPAAPSLRAWAQRVSQDAGAFLADLRVFYAIGRLRPDASVAQVAEELSAIARRSRQRSAIGGISGVVVTPVDAYLQGTARPVLWTMGGAALLMVLLACSSVAGLQVFRAAIGDHALAVHMALGAERRRLFARAVLEGLLLAVGGFIGAIVIAFLTTHWLVATAPMDVPHLAAARLTNWPVALFMTALTAITGVWRACGQPSSSDALTPVAH